jgi:hypothetical protein
VTLERRSGNAAEGVVVQTVTVARGRRLPAPRLHAAIACVGRYGAVLVNTSAEIAMNVQSASPVAYFRERPAVRFFDRCNDREDQREEPS